MPDKKFEELVNSEKLNQTNCIINNLSFSMMFGDIKVEYNLSLN